MAIREIHEQLLMADERVREAQKALDEAIREHWMASQARVKAEQEYYAEVQKIKANSEARVMQKIERLDATFRHFAMGPDGLVKELTPGGSEGL